MAKEGALDKADIPKEEKKEESSSGLSLDAIMSVLSVRENQIRIGIGLVISLLIGWIFWPIMKAIPDLWFNENGYFQFAPLVPFAIAYIVYANWDWISKTKVKPSWLALPFLLTVCYVSIVANQSGLFSVALVILMICMVLCTLWMLFGFMRALALSPAVLYSSFALPVFTRLIDENTSKLQMLSTEGAYQVLKLIGYDPYKFESNVIHLDRFTLNIAEACAGMKLTLAMAASVTFIMLVARLKWWKNLLLVALSLPLAVAINSLRIATIGVIGNDMGSDNGMWFHDYGSYLFLALAFYIVYKISVWMGWKI